MQCRYFCSYTVAQSRCLHLELAACLKRLTLLRFSGLQVDVTGHAAEQFADITPLAGYLGRTRDGNMLIFHALNQELV